MRRLLVGLDCLQAIENDFRILNNNSMGFYISSIHCLEDSDRQ